MEGFDVVVVVVVVVIIADRVYANENFSKNLN